MIAFLRFFGIMNAAVWFGAAVFFSFGIAPAFFTPEMKRLLGEIYAGLVAQSVIERYFVLHYCCGGLALLHQLAEWVYLGKALQRLTFGLLLAILTFSLLGGFWLQPKLKELYRIRHGRANQFTAEQKSDAANSFRRWHEASQIINLVMLASLGLLAWRVSVPQQNGTRFTPGKFRG